MLPGCGMLILLEGDRQTAKFTIIKDELEKEDGYLEPVKNAYE